MSKIIRENFSSVGFIWKIRLSLAKFLLGTQSVMGNCNLINVETTINKSSFIYGCRFFQGTGKYIKKAFPKSYKGNAGITLKPLKRGKK